MWISIHLIFTKLCEVGLLLSPFYRKLKHREVKHFPQSHTACKRKSQDSSLCHLATKAVFSPGFSVLDHYAIILWSNPWDNRESLEKSEVLLWTYASSALKLLNKGASCLEHKPVYSPCLTAVTMSQQV